MLTPLRDQVGLKTLVRRLPIVTLTLAAEDIDFSSGPDEGQLAEITTARDTAKEVANQARGSAHSSGTCLA